MSKQKWVKIEWRDEEGSVVKVYQFGSARELAAFEHGVEEALGYLEQRLTELGVVAALRAAGFEPGDELRVGSHELEFYPGA